MAEPVFERLRRGPLLCDGAMGTMLYARARGNLLQGRCFDELALSNPELVQTLHREYILAGAQMIETNTFGANAAKLRAYGLADAVRTINRRAAQIAREAREIAGQSVFVAGAVGPSGLLQIPGASDDDSQLLALRALFREQIEALAEGGVDLVILETFSSLTELRQAVLAAREVGNLPLIAQATFSEDGFTLAGESPATVASELALLGVRVIGSNCGMGPAGILDAVGQMREALRQCGAEQDVLLSAQPNAGLPMRVENRFLYVSTPEYFAEYARRFVEAGVQLVGGCCGTTPAHIAAMRATLAELHAEPIVSVPVAEIPVSAAPYTDTVRASEEPAAAAPAVECTRLQQALDQRRFVVSVELDPPKGLNPQKILDGAAHLKSCGVEFINIADSPMARVRMSCLALARLLRDQLDVESIVHFTTRDRNLMALQSDLLGAHALGIRNILALTGDPVRAGNYPNLTGVWNVDSVGLIQIVRGLNAGHDAAGAALGVPAHFFVGAALNLNMQDEPINLENERARHKLFDDALLTPHPQEAAADLEHAHPHLTETELELHRLRHKLAAGAQYIMTQPIYSIEPLERFLAAFGPVPVPVILGMIPLHSSKHAEYLHNEVPGISIPDEVRARMREAGEHGREVGIEIAYDIIRAATEKGLIQGCYLMPSYGRYDLVGELAQALQTPVAP